MDSPQSWNRYSYVLNGPINLNDPTGHDGVPPWVNTIINALNPFPYDTWFVSARGALKNIIGVEGDITIYADLKKEKVSINFESALSFGASEKLRGAVVVGSTKSDIDDIPGVGIIFKDGVSGNIAGCHILCGGIVPAVDKNLEPKTKAFLFGWVTLP